MIEASFAYAGGYAPNGSGITRFRVDPATGMLTRQAVEAGIADPTRLLIDRQHRMLYAASEVTPDGTVSAYRIGPDGSLALVNRTPSAGGKPVYLSLHPTGRYLFVANYDGGTVAVLPVQEDGRLGPAMDVREGSGPLGPARALDLPPGSFADSGHDAPHAHAIESDPTGRFVLHTDLGRDRIYVWRFDPTTGRLGPAAPSTVTASPGSGPRHLCWHHDGSRFHVLTEESSTVTAYGFVDGVVTEIDTVSALPLGFAGTSYASDLVSSKDGRFLYAANRLHDSIATFATEGGLRLLAHCPSEGSYPRTLVLRDGFLYAMNQRSDAITVFRLTDGLPRFTGLYIPIGSPAHLAFLD